MVEEPESWPTYAPGVKEPGRIRAWGAEEAKARFLGRFKELV